VTAEGSDKKPTQGPFNIDLARSMHIIRQACGASHWLNEKTRLQPQSEIEALAPAHRRGGCFFGRTEEQGAYKQKAAHDQVNGKDLLEAVSLFDRPSEDLLRFWIDRPIGDFWLLVNFDGDEKACQPECKDKIFDESDVVSFPLAHFVARIQRDSFYSIWGFPAVCDGSVA
jgi:hypothetical protein